MRVVWVVGAESSTFNLLKPVFDPHKLGGMEYVLKFAATPEQVDEKDLSNPGIIYLFDAFCMTAPGFEGIKQLRSKGLNGLVFLFGEPALEMTSEAFKDLKISGIFPNFESIDLNLAAGTIHNRIYYDGEVNLDAFLTPGGRSSSETIHNFKEFSSFGIKLATFLGKFGIDLVQLKRLLLGLTLPHIKTHSGTPQVEQPFTISYAVDKKKILISTKTFSKGSTKESLLNDFSDIITHLKSPTPPQGTIFPELNHVARVSEAILIFTGSAYEPQPNVDPIAMVSFLNFPNSIKEKSATHHVFGFCDVSKTPEYEEFNPESELPTELPPVVSEIPENTDSQANQENLASSDQQTTTDQTQAETTSSVAENPDSQNAQPSSETQPTENSEVAGTIPQEDVTQILNDPMAVIGDTPKEVDPFSAPTESEAAPELNVTTVSNESIETTSTASSSSDTPTVGIVETKVNVVEEEEYLKLKELVNALSQDVRRLMKERRTPTTDKELRESYTQLEERLKKSNAEKLKLEEEIAEKLKLIETLKAQVETLSRNKAA